MSFFPPGFDPRDDLVGILQLANVNTPDGDFGFMLGSDGRFVDVNGKEWWGTVLIGTPEQEMSINGVAPSGQIALSWFADPTQTEDGATLIDQVKALGSDYVAGRAITFYVQPLTDMNQLWAPVLAPIPRGSYEMTSIGFSLVNTTTRTLSLSWEGAFAGRNTARGYHYTTEDHAKLIGAANPSLTYAPMDGRQTEKLF